LKPVAGINVPTGEDSPVISADGLELYFDSSGSGASDLRVATRLNRNDPFQPPTIVQGINSGADEDPGSISADGLTLYFGSDRAGGIGNYDMYRSTRADRQSPFGNVTSLGAGANTSVLDNYPFVSDDGLSVYYHRSSGGAATDHRLWTATRNSTGMFADPQDLGAVVNGQPTLNSWRPTVSSDGLALFFSDGPFATPRPGGSGGGDIWVAWRDGTTQPFGTPVNVNNLWPGSTVNGPSFDGLAYISLDWPAPGSKLYFTTGRGGATNGDIWEATWVPEPCSLALGLLAYLWLDVYRRGQSRPNLVSSCPKG
jgi:hypothetical protein